MNEKHKHEWKEMFTEMQDGAVIKSYLRCKDATCDGHKVVDGKFLKEMENTWAYQPAHITK